jgi:hypothetical protein
MKSLWKNLYFCCHFDSEMEKMKKNYICDALLRELVESIVQI